MTLRRLSRWSAIGALLCMLAASWLTFVAPTANALTQEGFVITDGEEYKRSYRPIAGNNPAGEAHTPDVCATSAYCDVIPLEVVVPEGKDPEEEYFIQVQMLWRTDRAPGDPVLEPDGYTLNDMDMYLYTDPADPEEAEARGHTPDSTSDPWVANGASGTTPERALLFKPEGKYQIVVVNYLGANSGYELTVTWFNESIPTPYEKLAEEFTPSTTTTSTTIAATTTTAPAGPTTTTTPPPTLQPVVIEDDDDFDSGEFDTDFEEELAAPAAVDLERVAAASPEPPSGLALFFWLLAVPLGIVAIGGTVVLRRRATL